MGPEWDRETLDSTFHMLPDRAQAAANRRHGDAGSNDERFGRAHPNDRDAPAPCRMQKVAKFHAQYAYNRPLSI
jgi:hypothetical protein